LPIDGDLRETLKRLSASKVIGDRNLKKWLVSYFIAFDMTLFSQDLTAGFPRGEGENYRG